MDIEVSSNFERLLFNLYDQDSDAIAALMASLKQNGSFTLSDKAYKRLKSLFSAALLR